MITHECLRHFKGIRQVDRALAVYYSDWYTYQFTELPEALIIVSPCGRKAYLIHEIDNYENNAIWCTVNRPKLMYRLADLIEVPNWAGAIPRLSANVDLDKAYTVLDLVSHTLDALSSYNEKEFQRCPSNE